MKAFSLSRTAAMIKKEFRQILRDKGTLAMIVAMPLLLMLLFGYAINTNPRHMPTALITSGGGELVRSMTKALENTQYFALKYIGTDEGYAQNLMKRGAVQFIVYFPPNLERALMRDERPRLLISIDGADPSASAQVAQTLDVALAQALARDKFNLAASQSADKGEFELIVHTRYNPELLTRYQIVPGLVGILLTLTTILLTSISMTREYERGTMENLLATPLRPLEVMTGKILPYLFIAYGQIYAIFLIARYLFGLPPIADWGSLFVAATLLMLANLGVGFTFSTLAKNQLQAMQMTYFFFMPSLLLSGFMFPFYGMPLWAQALGEIFPLTHFLRIIRGIWLKNASAMEFSYDIAAIFAFLCASTAVSLWRYKRTLD